MQHTKNEANEEKAGSVDTERIKQLARAYGKSLTQIAKEASISPSTLSRILEKRTSPTLDTLAKIAKALNEPLTGLIVLTDPNEQMMSLSTHYDRTVSIKIAETTAKQLGAIRQQLEQTQAYLNNAIATLTTANIYEENKTIIKRHPSR